MKEESDLSLRIENLYVYAKMKQDENTAIASSQSIVGRANNLAAEISASASFISPEIIASYTEEELVALSREKAFEDYSYALTELARNRKRYLSDKEEKILARASELAGGYQNAFTMFDNADVKFAPVKNEEGKKVALTHGVYGELMMSKNRSVRRAAYKSMFTASKDMINTVGALYLGNIKKDEFYSYFHGYNNALEMCMDGENVDVRAYQNLLESVNEGIPSLKKYLKTRKNYVEMTTFEVRRTLKRDHVFSENSSEILAILNLADRYKFADEPLKPEDFDSLIEGFRDFLKKKEAAHVSA